MSSVDSCDRPLFVSVDWTKESLKEPFFCEGDVQVEDFP